MKEATTIKVLTLVAAIGVAAAIYFNWHYYQTGDIAYWAAALGMAGISLIPILDFWHVFRNPLGYD
jgi:hypothetical protein